MLIQRSYANGKQYLLGESVSLNFNWKNREVFFIKIQLSKNKLPLKLFYLGLCFQEEEAYYNKRNW